MSLVGVTDRGLVPFTWRARPEAERFLPILAICTKENRTDRPWGISPYSAQHGCKKKGCSFSFVWNDKDRVELGFESGSVRVGSMHCSPSKYLV